MDNKITSCILLSFGYLILVFVVISISKFGRPAESLTIFWQLSIIIIASLALLMAYDTARRQGIKYLLLHLLQEVLIPVIFMVFLSYLGLFIRGYSGTYDALGYLLNLIG